MVVKIFENGGRPTGTTFLAELKQNRTPVVTVLKRSSCGYLISP